MRIPAYKRLLITIGIMIALLLISSCNATKRFEKAVNKYGQKEAVNYIVTHYPEYFAPKTVHDTAIVQIPIYDPGDTLDLVFDCDSIIQSLQDGTNVAFKENDRLKLEIQQLGKKLKIKSTLKPKTIMVHDTIVITTKVPCPDIDKLSTHDVDILKEQVKHKKSQITSLYLIIALLVAGFIGFEYFKYNKKQDKTI